MTVTAIHNGIQYEIEAVKDGWLWSFQPPQGRRRSGKVVGEPAHVMAVVRRAIEVSIGETNGYQRPLGDGHRNGAVKKRSQLETKIEGENQWTKRDRETGQFMDNKEADKFKGVPREQ